MSKAIMISIQPQWVEKILNGEKTIEIRKTIPKCELPCKVYIYMTKKRHFFMANRKGEEVWFGDGLRYDKTEIIKFPKCDVQYWHLIGKVVAEFTLNKVDTYDWDIDFLNTKQNMYYIKNGEAEKTCLTYEELCNYGKAKTLYGWHIDNLKIYDTPKELSEFGTYCSGETWWKCDCCEYYSVDATEYETYEDCCCNNIKPLKRPPQSWSYVEGQDE